nr:MAG TPA: hypothetical protein [Caudoviricetes sp.]
MILYYSYLGPSQKEIDKAFESLSDEEYSLEGISLTEAKEKLKKRIASIRNIIQNVFNKILIFIQKGMGYLINGYDKNQRRIEAVKKILDNTDKLGLYKKALLSMYTRTPSIVNQNGSLIDLDQFEKDREWYLKEVENSKDGSIINEKTFSQSCYRVEKRLFKSSGIVVSEIGQLDKLTIDSVEKIFNLETMKRLDKSIARNKLPKEIGKLSDQLHRLESNNPSVDDYEEIKGPFQLHIPKVARKTEAMKTTFLVYQCLVFYIKSILSEVMKKDVFIEPFLKTNRSKKPLLHLSVNELTVDELYPRYPENKSEFEARKSYEREILPKRISFSPSIEEAVHGIHHYVSDKMLTKPDGSRYIDVYIYEGIPDENTFVVKEKYIKKLIFDWEYTHEIVVVKNPIKIKKIGRARIELKYSGKSTRNYMGTLTHVSTYEYVSHQFLSE